MSKYITPTLSINSNARAVTTNPGPFSVALTGSKSMSLNVDTVDHFIMSNVPTTYQAAGFDYYTISSGLTAGKNPNSASNNVLLDGRGFTASAHSDGTTLDHHGCWIYIVNTTATTSKHIIAIGHTTDADIADDSALQATGGAADSDSDADLNPLVDGNDNDFANANERLFSLRAGEFAFFPYDYTGILYAQATGANQSLEFWRYDRVQ